MNEHRRGAQTGEAQKLLTSLMLLTEVAERCAAGKLLRSVLEVLQVKKALVGSVFLLWVTGAAGTATAAPILSSADPALAGSTLIDYNSAPVGSFTSMVFGAVTVNGGGGSLTIGNDDDLNGVYAPPFSPGDRFLDNRFGGATFEWLFSSPTTAFGMVIGAVNSVQQLSAYDGANNLIETLNVPALWAGSGFYGIAAPGIARVTLTSNGGDWIVTDDFRYNSTTAPEPGTLALLGLGLAAGVRRIRRRV